MAQVKRCDIGIKSSSAERYHLIFFLPVGSVDGTVGKRCRESLKSAVRNIDALNAERCQRRQRIKRRKISYRIVVQIKRTKACQQRQRRKRSDGIIVQVQRGQPSEHAERGNIRNIVAGKGEIVQSIQAGNLFQNIIPQAEIVQNKARLRYAVRCSGDRNQMLLLLAFLFRFNGSNFGIDR